MKIFSGKTIILAVTGSIAAYKAAELASHLDQEGADVRVAMTAAAMRFIGPLTFESLTHRPVAHDVLELGADSEIEHVALARAADLLLIAPATANTIAKLAHGLADDAVSAIALDTRAPIIVAPAMETGMWENAATQQNVRTLCARGITIIEPASGHLASGAEGKGRLANLDDIVAAARTLLARAGTLSGRRVVVTAGGTQEPIDPVRVITNHSSGKMGLALAEAALERGARVSFISAPIDGAMPLGAETIPVSTTEELAAAVLQVSRDADALIMAAAPVDFRSLHVAGQKIKKDKTERLTLELTRNPDILEAVARLRAEEAAHAPRVVVGFAAETDNLLENARVKLESKRLDLIVANPVPQSFGSDRVKATLLQASGEILDLEPMAKERLAEIIMDHVERRLNVIP